MAPLDSHDLEQIAALGAAIAAGASTPEMFDSLARSIAEALDASECDIYTYEPHDQTLHAVGAWAHGAPARPQAHAGAVVSLADRADFAAVLAERAVIEVHIDDPGLSIDERATMAAWDELATLTTPMTIGDSVVGLVNVVDKREPRRFAPEERTLFAAFAHATAMAVRAAALNRLLEVQNTRLEEELHERRRLAEELRALSLSDELTGLANRRGLLTLAEQELKLARRIHHRCTLAFIDVDGMKAINDSFGHSAGDEALRAAARLLEETFREADIVARVGGDEFVVLMIEAGTGAPEQAPERLAGSIARWRAAQPAGWAAEFDLSVGVASCPTTDDCSIDELLESADHAMYAAKRRRSGRRAGRPTG